MIFGNKIAKIEKLAANGKAEALKKLVYDKKADVRLAAIDGLGKCKGEVSFNTLTLLINDPDANVRLHVVQSLGGNGDPKTGAFLTHLREREKDAKVLAAISEVLKGVDSMKTST